MRTKDEIRARYRILECNGKYKVQILRYRLFSGLTWKDAVKRIGFYDYDTAIYDSLKEANHVIACAVDVIFEAQPDAWKVAQ